MARSSPTSQGSKGSSVLCCCPLFLAELKLPFWSLRETNGKVISVQESFAPLPKLRTLVIKLALFSWSLSVLIFDFQRYQDEFDFYFIYLTHWGLLIAIIYFLVSLLNTIFGVAEQSSSDAKPGFFVRFAWGLFSAAATNQALITILFWSIEHQRGVPVDYYSWMKHGVVALLILLEGLLVNRIPVRAKHYLFVFVFDTLYLIWSVVHDLLGIGNPFRMDGDPNTDDDAIYAVLNWKERPLFTSAIALSAIFLAAPLFFYILWSLSLYSFPCRYDGSSRRYLNKTGGDVESGQKGSNYYKM